MSFLQNPPRLGNQFDDDEWLQEYLERNVPSAAEATDEYRHLGELAGGELYDHSLADLQNEPVHTAWSPWGERVDKIEVTSLWRRAQRISAEHGLVASGYEDRFGEHARTDQFVKNYLIQASLDVYSCPLAMTDGAVRTLLQSGNRALIDRAVPRLTSRTPERMWTSGQWMTERTGGSDVGLSETEARLEDEQWRLHGTKWFTSATTSDMALTLARPQGNGPGGRGLALFYVELRDDVGRLQNIVVNRLKDKFGTRKVPTAELTLDGTCAAPVAGLDNGVKNITPMLNITRTWNSVAAAWLMRRAVALARDYSRQRRAFGSLLVDKPLHADTLAGMVAEQEAACSLAFSVVSLMGRVEHGLASKSEEALFRMLTPIAKLTTAKQAVAVTSEALESFGGAGYVEDTGLPRLLADSQVLPIWEGTTNVLSLDLLRAIAVEGAFDAFVGEVKMRAKRGAATELKPAVDIALSAIDHASVWLGEAMNDRSRLEAGARRFALTLGRTYQLASMIEHAQWTIEQGRSARALASARRFAATGIDCIVSMNASDASALA